MTIQAFSKSDSTGIRDRIRSQIRPFQREVTYRTGWGGALTFEEISQVLSPIMSRKLSQWGLYGQDIPDSIQTGLMRLWQQLCDDPDLLAQDGKSNAMWRTLAKCNGTAHARQNQKHLPFTDIDADGDFEVDEYSISGSSTPTAWWNSVEPWATWATATDARLDLTEAIQVIAEEYADDINGLAALYILTTQAEFYATLEALNVKKSTIGDRMTAIRKRLATLLADYAPGQRPTWSDRLQAGEIDPYLQVVDHYQDRPIALQAIYTLVTNVQPSELSTDTRECRRMWYYRDKCSRKFEAAYRQTAAI